MRERDTVRDMSPSHFFCTLLVSIATLYAFGQSALAQCVAGVYTFSPDRVVPLFGSGGVPVSPDQADWTLDYGTWQGGSEGPYETASLLLVKGENGGRAVGARMSSTRTFLYGKITARIRAPVGSRVVSTFITMSDVGDEIDWELMGARPTQPESVVFYKGISEYGVHGRVHQLAIGDISTWHDYEIDWSPERIIWSLDGVPVRIHDKMSAVNAHLPADQRWFPDTPSRIQLGIWEAEPSDWSGEAPLNWGDTTTVAAEYQFVKVEC